MHVRIRTCYFHISFYMLCEALFEIVDLKIIALL